MKTPKFPENPTDAQKRAALLFVINSVYLDKADAVLTYQATPEGGVEGTFSDAARRFGFRIKGDQILITAISGVTDAAPEFAEADRLTVEGEPLADDERDDLARIDDEAFASTLDRWKQLNAAWFENLLEAE